MVRRIDIDCFFQKFNKGLHTIPNNHILCISPAFALVSAPQAVPVFADLH